MWSTSSNINEVITAVLNLFFTKRFCTHKKHKKQKKHKKHQKAPKSTKKYQKALKSTKRIKIQPSKNQKWK